MDNNSVNYNLYDQIVTRTGESKWEMDGLLSNLEQVVYYVAFRIILFCDEIVTDVATL